MKSDYHKPQREMVKLRQELFAEKWALLYRGDDAEFYKILQDPRLKNPGVYLLAYSEKSGKDLKGKNRCQRCRLRRDVELQSGSRGAP